MRVKWTDGFRALAIVCLALAAAHASNLVQPAGKPFTPRFATDGGADAWGYRYVDNDTSGSVPGKPTYNWKDIRSVGTRVTGLSDDNVVGPFQLGFVFPLYWQRYTEFFVGSNGYLAFDDDANSAHPFPDMPAAQRPNSVIAPLMADLDFTGLTGNRGCWYWTNAACDTFVLQCESIPFWNETGTWNSFEIILSKRDSAVAFQYRVQVGAPNGTPTPGWLAGNDVVGIENISGLTGLRYLYGATPAWNNPHSGLAVRFFPPATSSYQFTDVWAKCAMSENSGGMFVYVAQPTYVWARFKNAGNQSVNNVPVSAEIRQGNNPPVFQWAGTIPTMPVGYETLLTFGRCSLTTTADYVLKVKSGQPGDQYLANDSILIEIRVVNYTFPTLLSYDVGHSGNVALQGFHGYAVKFIPPVYPIVIDTALFYFTGSAEPVTVLVYDDNGPRGSPGTLLASVAWTPQAVGGWSQCYLGGLNINVRSGGLYLGYTKNQGSMLLGVDSLLPHSRQNWEYTGAWAPMRTNEFVDLKIRTRIKQGTAVHNAGVTEVLAPAGLLDSGQVVAPQARIKNFGSFTENPNVTFRIPSAPPYLQTVSIASLGSNRDTLVGFPVWSARPGFGLVPRCSVYVASDIEPQNDTLSGAAFSVRYIDLGAVSVDRPRDTIEVGTAIAPKATVRNYGNTAENGVVRFSVPGTAYNQAQTVYLGVGVTDTVVFPVWTPPAGGYAARCSTEHTLDMYSPNDAASAPFFVRRRDAGAQAILAPAGDSVPPGPLSPSATVHNYGNVACQIPARFDICKINPGGDSLAYTSSDSAWVVADGDGTMTFPDQWTATGVLWRARLTTILDGDPNPVNDTMSSTFLVPEPGHDVGAIAILAPLGVVDTLVKTPAARVENFGSHTETFRTHYQIMDVDSTGAAVYSDSALATALGPGLTADLDFPNWTGHHWQGHYLTKCWTVLPGDDNHMNDTTNNTFRVLAVISDVGVKTIDVPTANVDSGTTVNPTVTVHNYGNSAASFDVTVSINDGSGYSSLVHVPSLGATHDTVVHDGFVPWPAPARGNWTVRCTTNLIGDLYNGNDTASKAVAVNVHDVGAVAIVVPSGGIPPITFTPQAAVHNYGTLREPCTVTFMINSTPPYIHTQSLTGLPPGVDSVVGFSDTILSPGSYTAKCSMYLATDQVPGNEVAATDFQVGTSDVGVQSILAPLNSLDTSVVITPSALVTNPGSRSASFPVRFTISTASDGVVYTGDTVVNNLPGNGGSVTVVFPDWAKPHAVGSYATKCSTMLAGDETPGNDAATSTFAITAQGGGIGWTRMTDIMVNAKHKRVKDGAVLAYAPATLQPVPYVYALKGNNTYEFYRYDVGTNTWVSRDSIPAYDRSGKKKGVKKGSSMTYAGDRKIYVTKGNNTDGFWQYDPTKPEGAMWTEMTNEVPTGAKACRQGTSMASATIDGTNCIYFLKGSGTYEFYRYNADDHTWATMTDAPRGASGKPYKNGSSIAYDGGDTVYCLKGSYNEFFAYSISNRNWVTLETMPRRVPGGTKKTKVKDGSEIAVSGRIVYALKGANTNEFWTYFCDSHLWYHGTDMTSGPKKVRNGGALVASTDGQVLYAFRGNNTLEFWRYIPPTFGLLLSEKHEPSDVQGLSAVQRSQFALSIAPNPFSGMARVSYSMPQAGNVSLRLYDVTGKLVSTLVSGYHPVGSYSYSLPTAQFSLASGIYLLKYESEGCTTTGKLVIE